MVDRGSLRVWRTSAFSGILRDSLLVGKTEECNTAQSSLIDCPEIACNLSLTSSAVLF
jgi:hypothetical protein